MAVTGKIFGKMFLAAFNAEHDLIDNTIKVMLCTSAYTPDQDVHDYKDDVTNEVTGTGYTAGGATLASKTLTYTAGTNKVSFDAADTTWSSSTITARKAVFYNDTPGTAGTKGLLTYQESDSDIVSTNGNFTIAHHADGIFEVTVT